MVRLAKRWNNLDLNPVLDRLSGAERRVSCLWRQRAQHVNTILILLVVMALWVAISFIIFGIIYSRTDW